MWISSPVLVELQALKSRGNNFIFFHWLHWSKLAAAGMGGEKGHSQSGEGCCSRWQKLLKKLLLNVW